MNRVVFPLTVCLWLAMGCQKHHTLVRTPLVFPPRKAGTMAQITVHSRGGSWDAQATQTELEQAFLAAQKDNRIATAYDVVQEMDSVSLRFTSEPGLDSHTIDSFCAAIARRVNRPANVGWTLCEREEDGTLHTTMQGPTTFGLSDPSITHSQQVEQAYFPRGD